jgi:hypothetical protein
MLAAFWEDYYEDHKLEARKGKDGEVVFETGDQYIDKWEKELAMGITPDLLEDLPSWHRDKMQKEQDRLEKQSKKNYEGDDFDDDGFDDNYESELESSSRKHLPVLGRRQ